MKARLSLPLALASIFLSTSPHAEPSPEQQQFVKNGMYCMSQVCIGDDISTLAHIQWDGIKANPVTASSPIMKNILAEVSPQPLEPVVDAAPYLSARQFDQTGIAKLAQVRGFCKSHANFQGTFQSESGHPSFVTARIEPSPDGKTQSIRVFSMSRQYPREYTDEQLSALKQQLTERYGKAKHGENDPSWGIGPDRGLFLRGPVDWDGGTKRRNLMKQFPGCGKALKID